MNLELMKVGDQAYFYGYGYGGEKFYKKYELFKITPKKIMVFKGGKEGREIIRVRQIEGAWPTNVSMFLDDEMPFEKRREWVIAKNRNMEARTRINRIVGEAGKAMTKAQFLEEIARLRGLLRDAEEFVSALPWEEAERSGQ